MIRQPRRSFGCVPAVLVAAAVVLGLPASWLTARGQEPVFRSAVDLIAVDVQVVDRDGQPMTTLNPGSFEVTLNGQKRRVQYAVFTRYGITPRPTGTNTMPPPGSLTDRLLPAPGARPESGRLFIVAIDAGSFRSPDAHLAVLAGQRFIDGLLPTDEVGVFTLPFGPRVLPTTDHFAAKRAVAEVTGRRVDPKGSLELTPADVIDILAAADTKPRYQLQAEVTRNRSGKPTFPAGSDDQMFDEEAIAKHCETVSDAICLDSVLSEANALALGLETDAQMSIAGLEQLLYLLQESPGRKTVLLLSGGMPLSDRGVGRPSVGNDLKRMGEQAAYANATVHAIYFDSSIGDSFSAEARHPATSSIRAHAIDTRALAEFASPSGGLLLMSQAGAGEREVDRLLGEMSASYVLGVEPEERDRDGRPHTIQVKVKQEGAKVRSRQLVVVPRSHP